MVLLKASLVLLLCLLYLLVQQVKNALSLMLQQVVLQRILQMWLTAPNYMVQTNKLMYCIEDVRHVEKESNRGDARAAVLAALHPLQFDPDHGFKLWVAMVTIKGENALALGVGYYPKKTYSLQQVQL